MGIKLESNDFVRVLTVVAVMAFIMISVAYGITYMFESDSSSFPNFPLEPYYILFIFSIGFVLLSVFFEKVRDAVYPYSLLGGAIASAIFTFVVTAAIGGMRYIWAKGFTGLGTDTLVYALSICIILSMVLFNLAKHKL
ncbi:Uncharacterised protein [uncultured archaeon]|nr:Uncharacterised protein [uncultured archaeon]